MRIVMFYHSLLSDWNHGNAHFLRGVVTELVKRGHTVTVREPRDAWSVANLVADQGEKALALYREHYPGLEPVRYDPQRPCLEEALRGADLVIVHEWNEPRLIAEIGRLKHVGGFRLLFHDTHHRSLTDRGTLAACGLSRYDGVLAYGEVIRRTYVREGWTDSAWTWHEAADVRLFRPLPEEEIEGDLVWVGNWGDGERGEELREFLLEPVRRLKLRTTVYGVRYPKEALAELSAAGIVYGGWLPNFLVPRVFARHRVTVHVPRRPYVSMLPGIPTIRPFEALACGIPLVSSPWRDSEGLFTPRKDFIFARNGKEMEELLARLLSDGREREAFSRHGIATIRSRHTCAHRVDELMEICARLGLTE